MKRHTLPITAATALLTFSVLGCQSEQAPVEPVSMADIGLDEGQSYADVVPSEFQSSIEHRDTDAPARTDNTPVAGATIFSTPESSIFPMPRQPRSFADKAELVSFVAEAFGADDLIYDENGNLEGARGSYAMIGSSFFEDADLGLRYRVTEPMLAFAGGARGTIEVAGETICVDPDGDCSTARASYLEPVGDLTAPTHDPECGSNGVCVEFHSFYNRTSFPFPWARHGSNLRFTTYSALPSTQMRTNGRVDVPPYALGEPFWTTFPMPDESNQGQDSVESAVWCFGTSNCVEHQATAVCGWGNITDPDIYRSRRTGNGPANNSRCPS